MTLSIDDHLLASARKVAAERGTSVNRMIRDFLARETGAETEDARRARQEMVEMARNVTFSLGGWKWNREDVYAERLSRYERADIRRDREGG